MQNLHDPDAKRALRRQLRRQRSALTQQQQCQAARDLCLNLKHLPEIQRARRISLYLPVNGEIDPTPLLPWLHKRNVAVYLPVLRPLSDNSLWFVAYHAQTPMVKNRFGILEPDTRFAAQRRNRLPAWALDTLIVPLVGFDGHANRMGMGGGFYDRSLAFMRRGGPAPNLIGVAHACQQVETLPVEPWDVPLSAVVSDEAVVRAGKKKS
ncbi:5-formyltetrahydrofolate cyclo-ligase [Halomonas aquamarina]|uniref:5-formyltetrahydrofolate cyclo-ligase n=1 Tax=Vreelandella aquamarina TaxID=77097 RepID=A0ACC5VU36_9GAMM|nr:5-formyltetrahydrofolate cyclo-ligase [Halomonas aquamarina]MBZ5487393.1 5-formyltetrahydrofolate cyclo-ligase [Halomonas aquamarina]